MSRDFKVAVLYHIWNIQLMTLFEIDCLLPALLCLQGPKL